MADAALVEYPRAMFMVRRPAETPAPPPPVLGSRTVHSAEEQQAAEAEGWYADQAAALAAAAAPVTPEPAAAPEPEPEPEPEVSPTKRSHRGS